MLTDYQKTLLNAVATDDSVESSTDYDYDYQSDEMYYNNKVKDKEKGKRKGNTLHHQVIDNVLEASPPSSPSEPSAVAEATRVSLLETTLERKGEIGSGPKKGFKRISVNDKYVEINVQVTNYRNEGRFKRINCYVSLKTDTDQKYSIFLSGAGTTAKAELTRGAKENQSVLDVISTFQSEIPTGMIARLHYKAPKGFVTDFHRGLLKSAMLCIDEAEGDFIAYLYLLGEYYNIPLNTPLSTPQKKHYIASGIWQDTYNLTDEDEFDD
jgi:hypothetical protein